MQYVLRFIILGVFLLVARVALSAEADILQVFLQGSSSSKVSDVVREAGGVVTHDLHLINAVGARLSPPQLTQVLKSKEITRHIGDLSYTERPPKEAEAEKCKVRGHIELDISPNMISWRLFNKRTGTAWMRTLDISWPMDLGTISEIRIGSYNVKPALFKGIGGNSLSIEFPESAHPEIRQKADLIVSFEPPGDAAVSRMPSQREFDLEASFVGGCSTDLVPGYENNHENYYYNEVAGVDALHLLGVTGKGVTVAIVDSGLWEHPALVNDTSGKSRLIARYNALSDVENIELVDESGHGTHMASIIANSEVTIKEGRPAGFFKGVAPDASLVAVKVLDREGLAHVLEIVLAIQWVVENRERYGIRILNLSFAQTPRWHHWEDPVNQAVMQAWKAGIAVVAAAGNEGPNPQTIGSPGNLPNIITVGAVTDSWTPETRDDDYIPDFSSRGPTPSGHVKPDIVGLGGHMTGLIYPDSALAREQPEDVLRTGEFVSTGSSQASAMISGVLALLLQLEPDLTPDDLKCKLISSAEPAINKDGKLAYSPFQQGFGYVTADRAVTLGKRGCGNADLHLKAQLANEEYFLGPAIMAPDGSPALPGMDNLIANTPSEEGLSQSRKWGVKDHIERLDRENVETISPVDLQLNWRELYFQERELIEKLSGRRETSASQ